MGSHIDMKKPETASILIDRVTLWAAGLSFISGVALVGSHARGEARPDSDTDLVLLCPAPNLFLEGTSWLRHFGHVLT